MKDNMNSEFTLDMVQVRLIKDAPLYSEEKISTPEAAIRTIGNELSDMDREVVTVINCKTNGIPINACFVSIGTLNRALFSPREILKSTILSNAASVVLVHNHPSGQLIPSKEDIRVTKRFEELCELLGISFLDHVIVGGDNADRYYSFSEHDMLKKSEKCIDEEDKCTCNRKCNKR